MAVDDIKLVIGNNELTNDKTIDTWEVEEGTILHCQNARARDMGGDDPAKYRFGDDDAAGITEGIGKVNLGGDKKIMTIDDLPPFKEISDSDEEGNAFFD